MIEDDTVERPDFQLQRAYQVVYWREFSPGLPFPTSSPTYQATHRDAQLVASNWEAQNLRTRDGQRTTYAEIIEISAAEIAERDLVPGSVPNGLDRPERLVHLEQAG